MRLGDESWDPPQGDAKTWESMNVLNKEMERGSDEQGLHTSLHSIGSDTKELKEEWDLDQQRSLEKPGFLVTFESPFHWSTSYTNTLQAFQHM